VVPQRWVPTRRSGCGKTRRVLVGSVEGSAPMRVTHIEAARMRSPDRQQAGMLSQLPVFHGAPPRGMRRSLPAPPPWSTPPCPERAKAPSSMLPRLSRPGLTAFLE
jgi:hypothetical protein